MPRGTTTSEESAGRALKVLSRPAFACAGGQLRFARTAPVFVTTPIRSGEASSW